MKLFLISFCMFLANLLCVVLIGFSGIQNFLTAGIYFLPIAIDITAVFLIYKSKPKQINLSFIILLALFLVLLVVTGLVFYLIDGSLVSVIALGTFVTIFDVAPLLLVLLIFNFWRATSK